MIINRIKNDGQAVFGRQQPPQLQYLGQVNLQSLGFQMDGGQLDLQSLQQQQQRPPPTVGMMDMLEHQQNYMHTAMGIGEEAPPYLMPAMEMQNLDGESFNSFKKDLDKLKEQEDMLLGSNPCHYLTETAAFNMTEIATKAGGSSAKTNQELFYKKTDEFTLLINLCNSPVTKKDAADLRILTQVGEPFESKSADGKMAALSVVDGGDLKTSTNITAKEILDASNRNKVKGVSLKAKDLPFQIDLICNKDRKDMEVESVKADGGEDGKTTVITIQNEKGCPVFNVSTLARFIAEHKNVWGAVLMLFGGFFCLFGRALLGVAVFLATSGLTFLIGTYFSFRGFDYFEITPPNVIFWIIIGAWAIAGMIVGWIFVKLQKYGVILLAIVAGLMFGQIITTAFLIRNPYVYWSIILSCPAGLCLFSLFCQNNVRILFTSLIGSYAVTRGTSSYFGGFPNELELQAQLKSGYITWNNFPKSFYLYFVAFIGILILSVCFQRWHLQNIKAANVKKQQKKEAKEARKSEKEAARKQSVASKKSVDSGDASMSMKAKPNKIN